MPTPAWYSRAMDLGPRLVSLLLAVAIAVECGRAALPLLRESAAASSPALIGANRRQHASGIDVTPIVAAHLFGVSATDESGDPATAAPTSASLVLDGIVATDNPRRGMAIITATGPAKVYRVGDAVEGAALHSVYRDHVILARDGRFERLSLRKFASTGNVDGTATAESTPAAEPGPQALADFILADASTDESEHLLGFRLSAGTTARAQFFRSGLRPGDLMTGVNGTSLTDQNPRRGQEIVDAMLTEKRATVSLVRNGKPMDVSVDLGKP